jgi:hypothetical protein
VSLSRRRALLDEAIAANDQLVGRLEDTLARIRALRDERAAIAVRLRESRGELELLSGAFGTYLRPGRTSEIYHFVIDW